MRQAGNFLVSIFCFIVVSNLGFAGSVRIKDVVEFSGVRGNDLVGYGLVVGLNGTGDGIRNAPFTEEIMSNILERLGVNVAGEQFRPKNVAAVFVTASLPAFARAGGQIDVTVSAIGDAKSLLGGTLIMTPLKAADGLIYAVSQGTIIAGDGMQKGALGPNALLGADQASGQYRFPGARADPKPTLPQNIPADPPIPLAQTALGPTSTPRSSTSKAFQMGAQIATLPAMTAEGQMQFQWGETMGDARSSGELSTEVRISVGPSAKSAIPHAAVPAQITRQIAEHIPAAIGKPVQITLQPEELGRVRLSVAVSETGVIVSILAERGETLDLMRRNIDQLQQDFQTLGFGTADFLFQSEGDLSDAESNPDQDADTEGSELLSDNGATIVIQAEGLDMRI